MNDPIQFETLRTQIAAAQNGLYCAIYSTQNMILPDDAAYKASVLAGHRKLSSALLAFLRHLKT